MNGLYMIDHRIRMAEEKITETFDAETGEIVDEKAAHDLALELEALDMEKEEAIEGAALIRQEKLREAEAIKAEIDRLTKMKKAAEREADRLKRAITISLNGDKMKTDKISIYYTTTHPVEVDDLDAIPEQYIKVTREAKKEALGKLLRNGAKIDGVHIGTNKSTIIK